MQNDHNNALSELERYKMLVENVQDYAIFFMNSEGYIQTWNKGAEKNKGYTHKEIIGKHFSIFYSDKDRRDQKPEKELQIAKKLGRVEDEDWRIKKDGSKFWANVVITALFDDNGELQGFAKVTRNLTERKANEDSLKTANYMLQAQQKELQLLNDSKDEFISLASHQLRTPATAIKQLLGMLLDGFAGDIPESIRGFLEKTYESNERQIAIVNSLLKVAQIDSGKITLKKEIIDINNVVESIIRQYQGVISGRNQSISSNFHPSALYGYVDHQYYRMALENIIDNASKYTEEGGEIIVSTMTYKNRATVSVRDTGVGVADEDVPNLFEKFNRIENDLSHQVAGSGLGLYWVKKVIELHQGAIRIESKVNVGTTFFIDVPIGEIDA